MTNLKKILVVGDGGVGKTSLINCYLGNSFEQKYISTYNIDIRQNNEYILYDFPGQEKYGSHDINLHDTDICIIMYDVTSKLSYKNIESWKLKVENLCGNIPHIIVGNKIDSDYRQIIDNNTINISVKNQDNIQNLFEFINTHFENNA